MQSSAADTASTDEKFGVDSSSNEPLATGSSEGGTDAAASAEEVEAVIAELEAYRQRLIDDTMDIARKIKLPKKAAQAQVDSHPEIAKVTQLIQGLRDRQGNSPN